MLQLLISGFVQAIFLGIVALIIGRYAGRKLKRMPVFASSKVMVFLKVWAATYATQLSMYYMSYWAGLVTVGSEPSFLLGTIIPIAVGAVYAHRLLLSQPTAS